MRKNMTSLQKFQYNRLLSYIAVMILFLCSVSAYNVTDAHNLTFDSGSSVTLKMGIQFTALANSTLEYVTKDASCTASSAGLYNNVTMEKLCDLRFIGGNDAFPDTPPCNIYEGVSYAVIAHDNTNAYTRRYYYSASPVPPIKTGYNVLFAGYGIYLDETNSTWSRDSRGVYNIVSITTSRMAVSDTTPPSFADLKHSGNTTYILYNMSINVTINDAHPNGYVLYWNYSSPSYTKAYEGTYTSGVNLNISLNRTFEDKTVCFYFYANDTYGNNAVSETKCFLALNNYSIVPKLLYPNYNVITGYTIKEQQPFFIALNNSKNLIQQTTPCNVSAINISAHFDTLSPVNIAVFRRMLSCN